MINKDLKVQVRSGLEARATSELVQLASQYVSTIYLECGDKKINAKSLMGMMSLGLVTGEDVKVVVDGDDEETAMEKIESFLTAS
ncbi:MAG: HPr family phosphocarrier protein [Lachnospiraceae bacterium]|nr:HPr family phosphocarrier protein [Lachnospiraceae bacterium]